jgi:phage gpG-like protein
MQIQITQLRDLISPDLANRLRLAADQRGIHQAIGLSVISITKRAFNDTSLRASPWPNLASGAPARLRKSGTLAKSPRVVSATDSAVTVGSDRKYAAIHQLGGTTAAHIIRARNAKALFIPGIGFRKQVNHPGSKIPARPYFPFTATGQPTPRAHTAILQVIEKRLTP